MRPFTPRRGSFGLEKSTFLQSFGRARKLLLACLEKNGVRLEEVLA